MNFLKNQLLPFVKKYRSPLKLLAFILILFFVFDHILLCGVAISGSMEPTIMTNDAMLGNRLAYCFHSPKRGDIISFQHGDEVWCKRVVAIAGDHVSFQDGYVYINDQKDEEPYLDDDVETNCTKEFTVPDGKLFVLGDHREYSYDSRYWDNPYVNCSDVLAKIFIILPLHLLHHSNVSSSR